MLAAAVRKKDQFRDLVRSTGIPISDIQYSLGLSMIYKIYKIIINTRLPEETIFTAF